MSCRLLHVVAELMEYAPSVNINKINNLSWLARSHNPLVPGSSPGGPTKNSF
jgi:hypothetical protein